MVSIAEAAIDIRASTAKLRNDLAKGQAEVRKFQGGLERGFRGLRNVMGTLGIGVGISQIISFGARSLEAAGAIGELADQLGVSAENLQVYQFAAKQSGVSTEQLEGAINKLSVSIGNAANGEKAATEASRRLGVAFVDAAGNARSTDDVIRDLAEGYKNATDKTRFAADMQDVMGRSARRLVTIFEDGAAGLDNFATRARELGLVLSDDLVRQADEASDQLSILHDWLSKLAAVGTINIAINLGLIDASLDQQIDAIRKRIEMAKLGFGDAGLTADTQSDIEALEIQLHDLLMLKNKLGEPPAATGGGEDGGGTSTSRAPATREIQAEESALGELLATMRKETELLGETEHARLEYETTLKATAAAQDDYDKLLRDSPLLTGEEKAAIQAVVAEREKEQEALDEIKRQQEAVEQAADDAARAQQDAADATAQAWQEAGDIIGEVIGSAIEDLIKGDFDWKNFLAELAGGFAEMWISNAIGSLTGSFGGVPIGSFAEGGSFSAGAPMLVGEEGPELMVPHSGGMVIPNGEWGGNNFYINAPGSDAAGLRRLERLIRNLAGPGVVEMRAKAEILDAKRRGGSFGRLFA